MSPARTVGMAAPRSIRLPRSAGTTSSAGRHLHWPRGDPIPGRRCRHRAEDSSWPPLTVVPRRHRHGAVSIPVDVSRGPERGVPGDPIARPCLAVIGRTTACLKPPGVPERPLQGYLDRAPPPAPPSGRRAAVSELCRSVQSTPRTQQDVATGRRPEAPAQAYCAANQEPFVSGGRRCLPCWPSTRSRTSTTG